MGSSNTAKDDNSTDGAKAKTDHPSDSTAFAEGEKVLAYHGPCIYEAKVQKVEVWKKEQRYFVHYLGWNKNWDEWVGMDRLLKFTEDNVRKQQTLSKKQGADKNPKSGRSTQIKPKSSTEAKVDKEDLQNNASKGKKRKVESGIEEDTVSADKHVKIQIPSTLKKQLVDDYEFVTQLGKLVKLPRSPSVDDIMMKYLEYKGRKTGKVVISIPEVLKGLRQYFNKAMSMMLLYKQERRQYREAITKDKVCPSKVYGAEHFLRLYVKLPELLAYVTVEEETLPMLQQILHDFLKFIQKNQSTFFLSSYDGPKVDCEEEDD